MDEARKTNRQLDAAMAELLGQGPVEWKWIFQFPDGSWTDAPEGQFGSSLEPMIPATEITAGFTPKYAMPAPHYSTDMNAAMAVWDWLRRNHPDGYNLTFAPIEVQGKPTGKVTVQIIGNYYFSMGRWEGDTFAESLCRLADEVRQGIVKRPPKKRDWPAWLVDNG